MSRRQRSDAQSTSGLEGVSRGVNVGVNECINDWKKFQLALEKGMKSCESVAEDLLSCQQQFPDLCSEDLSLIENYLMEITVLHQGADNVKRTLDESRELLTEPNGESPLSLMEQFDVKLEEIQQADNRSPNEHPNVKEFKDMIKTYQEKESEVDTSIQMNEGEELGMGRVERSLNCPITRQLMEDPVKCKKCSHTYTKKAIISHIRSRPKGRAKCPVGGCPAYVLEDDLEKDEEIEKLIRRSQRSERH